MGGRSKRKCAGGSVNGFHEGEAAAAFAAVADGLRVVGDCMEEVFEDGSMAADVGYGGGGGALVGVAGAHIGEVGRRISQVGGDDTVAREGYRSVSAADW